MWDLKDLASRASMAFGAGAGADINRTFYACLQALHAHGLRLILVRVDDFLR